ncbi:MAG: peptidoglycan-binding domain-containing protein [Candidatus Omnitrophica bacterium]|nr:peptidoglycan-binding domain-containing protein [Candidatus Omnitrophota bacterium]
MRHKRGVVLLLLSVFVISLSGCATARKQSELDMQGLRNQVSVLESQLRDKDNEIYSLQEALNQANAEKEISARKKISTEVKSRPNTKQIQAALANAGFNPGAIDGRMGRQTRDAIRAFQRANGLTADGKVGKKTWELLRGYLSKKVK